MSSTTRLIFDDIVKENRPGFKSVMFVSYVYDVYDGMKGDDKRHGRTPILLYH